MEEKKQAKNPTRTTKDTQRITNNICNKHDYNNLNHRELVHISQKEFWFWKHQVSKMKQDSYSIHLQWTQRILRNL